jgi:hypothetical protein
LPPAFAARLLALALLLAAAPVAGSLAQAPTASVPVRVHDFTRAATDRYLVELTGRAPSSTASPSRRRRAAGWTCRLGTSRR